MLRLITPCLLILSLLCPATPALAHRVHLFAYVEQGQIVVDGRFSKAKPVQNGIIEIVEAESGKPLVQGKTDSQGAARFAIPAEIAEQPVDLRLTIKAGEGHQGEWILPAAELNSQTAALPPSPETTPAPHSAVEKTPSAPVLPATANTSAQVSISVQELEAMINRSLDARLGPIKAMLAAEQAKGPGFIEIIGGIGWIFGILALLLVWKNRKKTE
ncbi:MAG: cobalamin biosynthesis protein CbiL [Desulfobulbaceae bacterium]|nr:cobalamin biosynthesis protein CbiL [Desulfobulbaceae bacterium]